MKPKLRVLVVDDVEAVRESLRFALEEAGFEVVLASTGEEAMSTLDRAAVGAVLTDVFMPGLDGIGFLRRLRSLRPRPRLLAMTGGGPDLSLEATVTLAQVWGAERVFLKPFDERELVSVLASASRPQDADERPTT